MLARIASTARENVRQLISGARGPGGFPPPAQSLLERSPLWRWSEVAKWLQADLGDERITDADVENAAFVAVLNHVLGLYSRIDPSMASRIQRGIRAGKRPSLPKRHRWQRLLNRS